MDSPLPQNALNFFQLLRLWVMRGRGNRHGRSANNNFFLAGCETSKPTSAPASANAVAAAGPIQQNEQIGFFGKLRKFITDPDVLQSLAAGFNGMSMNPNPYIGGGGNSNSSISSNNSLDNLAPQVGVGFLDRETISGLNKTCYYHR